MASNKKIEKSIDPPQPPESNDWLRDDIAFERYVKSIKQVPGGLAISNTGSHSFTMGMPIFQEPSSASSTLNNLVCREVLDPSEDLEPISPTVTNLENTVRALSMGRDITPYKENIQRVASNQPEKNDVVRAYMNQIDHENLADLTVMRAASLRVIKQASRRNDVTVSEALVIWKMCNEQIPEIKRGLSEDQNRAVDTITVVEKIDINKQQVERSVQQRWEGTTPQGRELIRKKLWELGRNLASEAIAVESSAVHAK